MTTPIGTTIHYAHVFDLKKRQQGGIPMNTDALQQNVNDLFNLLQERQIDYVLVGGIAMLTYIAGRNTEDIDLIMAVDSLEKMPEIELVSQDMYFARGQFHNLQIDLLLTSNPLFAEVQHGFVTEQTFAEQTIATATVEGLVLLKLYALPSLYRQGNFVKVGLYENDIATLLYEYKPDLAPLLARLRHYLSPSDTAEVETILTDINQRITRFRRRPDGG